MLNGYLHFHLVVTCANLWLNILIKQYVFAFLIGLSQHKNRNNAKLSRQKIYLL